MVEEKSRKGYKNKRENEWINHNFCHSAVKFSYIPVHERLVTKYKGTMVEACN